MFSWPILPRMILRAEVFIVHAGAASIGDSRWSIFPSEETTLIPNIPIQSAPQATKLRTTFPELELVALRDSVVMNNSRFNSVVKGKEVVIPSRKERGPWRLYMNNHPRLVAGVRGQEKNYVAIALDLETKDLEVALYVGTRGAYNWYHWLANLLPALYVANQSSVSSEIPLVLPEELKDTPQVRESLGIFIRNRPIVWLGKEKSVSVRTLFWADSPVDDAPFSIARQDRRPLSLHPSAMQGFRAEILKHYAEEIGQFQPVERVYLARKPWSSRHLDDTALRTYLAQHGFVSVYSEDLSFGEQVALWHHAKSVVGMTGAAFTNIMFSNPRVRALRLVKSSFEFENYFANLSSISGAEIRDFDFHRTQDKNNEAEPLHHPSDLQTIVDWFA